MNTMNKFSLLCVIVVLGAASTAAQVSPRYRYDNFDTRRGVSAENASRAAAAPTKNLRLTAKTATTSVELSNVLPTAKGRNRPVVGIAMTISKSLDGFTTGIPNVDALIVESGSRNNVDPVLIYAIMHRESAFKAHAVSYKGARGLMQLMPGTAARFGVSNIFNPRQNIEGGARYMRFLLNFFGGDVRLALAGYNAGEGAVLKYGRRIPPYSETQEYVRRITQRYALMRDPQTALKALVITPVQVAAMKAETSLQIYERQVFAVRLADGRLRLVSQ